MSTRANLAAAAAGVGVLALGWNLGTANSQTVLPTAASQTNSTQTSTTTRATATSGQATALPSAESTSAESTSAESTAAAQTSSSNGQNSSQTTAATTPASSSAGSGTLKDGTWTGTSVSYRYGSLQVSVTVSGGKITALNPTVVSDGERRSDEINSRAIPVLESEIVAANSAQVDTVGGATYTCDAYLQSLQSALNQAK